MEPANMRVASFIGALLFSGLVWVQGAAASTIAQAIDFTASNFVSIPPGHTAPVDPVIGSFLLNFDPTLDTTNDTNITVNALNINLGGVGGDLKFDYTASTKLLQVHTGDSIGVSGGTNSLWLALFFGSNPPFSPFFTYAQVGNSFAYQASNVSVALTPIPGSILMLLTGLTAIGGVAFARRDKLVAA